MSEQSKAAIITAEAGIARGNSLENVWIAAKKEKGESAGMADEIPFAPFE